MKRGSKNKSVHKGYAGVQREAKKEQGFFDGRFMTRAVKSKKEYTRKIKHKN